MSSQQAIDNFDNPDLIYDARTHSKIVWDATNIRRDFRQQIINISRDYGALVTLAIFHCSKAVYFERNKQRRHSIPEDVLVKQIEQLEFPEFDEGDRILVIDENGNTLARYGYLADKYSRSESSVELVLK